MANLPGAIIYINNDLNSILLEKISSQLFIWETITEITFIARIATDPDYINTTKLARQRILVTCDDIKSSSNKLLSDLVLFVKSGLAYVLQNNYGPPTLTLPIDRLYLNKLFTN